MTTPSRASDTVAALVAGSSPATAPGGGGSTADRLAAVDLLAALAVPRRGSVLDLGMPIDREMPQGERSELFPFCIAQTVTPRPARGYGFEVSAESIVGSLHTSTHVDAVCHVLADGHTYGGFAADDVRTDSGWTAHGVETLPPIIARGLVADVAALHGVDALADEHEISLQEIDMCLDAARAAIRPGDALLLRTGKIRRFYLDGPDYGRRAPGLSGEAGIALHERGMAVLASDTPGTERLPFADPARTLHRALLAERGTVLVENLNLEPAHEVTATVGLFVCLPLKITGATGSWVRPALII